MYPGEIGKGIYNSFFGESDESHRRSRTNHNHSGNYRRSQMRGHSMVPRQPIFTSSVPINTDYLDEYQPETSIYASSRIPFRMKCYPLIVYQTTHPDESEEIKIMECSNKIIAPDSVIQKLCQYGNIQSEYVFQINSKRNRVTIGKYYNYNPEFGEAEHNTIYVPNYIFEGLSIEYGDEVSFNFINESLPKGDYIRLQPITNQIMQVDNYQLYLQEHLQKHYTCLIKGESIRIPYFDEVIVMMIHDLTPSDIVSITDTDLAVEFEPSLEQKEIEKQQEELLKAEQKRAEEQMQEQQRKLEEIRLKQMEEEKQNSSSTMVGAFNPGTMRFKRPVDESESKPESEPKQDDGFVAFSGKGNTLSEHTTTVDKPNQISKKALNELRLRRLKFLDNKIKQTPKKNKPPPVVKPPINTMSGMQPIVSEDILKEVTKITKDDKNKKKKPKFKLKLKKKPMEPKLNITNITQSTQEEPK